jgi:hypothetical protein
VGHLAPFLAPALTANRINRGWMQALTRETRSADHSGFRESRVEHAEG